MTTFKPALSIVLLALAGCSAPATRPTAMVAAPPAPTTAAARLAPPATQQPPAKPAGPAAATTASAPAPMPAPAMTRAAPPAAQPAPPIAEPKPARHAQAPVVAHHAAHRAHHPRRHRVARRTHRAPALAHKAAPSPVRALTGSVTLVAGNGQSVSAADYRHTVVYFVPASGHDAPTPGQYTVYTHHRDFDPDWLAIPQGSTVTFTNLDQVKHNVFSVTPGDSFDLGYQSAQQSETHRFDHPGMVLISCHVHRYMRGNVLVIPSRYVTTVSSTGQFKLSGVPDAPGRLYFWNPRARGDAQSVTPPYRPVSQRLVIDRPAVKTEIDLGGGS